MKSISLLTVLGTFLAFSSSEANPLSRIVNGHEAANYQFPWHVSLVITQIDPANTTTYCGGSLIAAQFVLTAASCLRSVSTIQVDIGSIEFNTPYQTLHTTQFQIHPQYSDEFKLNNIAVIRLPTSVEFQTNIRAILLPRISEQNEEFISVDTYVSGFGVATAGSVYLSNELRYAHQTVISNDVCRESFDHRYIHDSTMCAVGYNDTTQALCYGDQGGALVSHIAGSWLQLAVSSLIHSNGCTGTVPDGYTRVAPYLQWISSLTGIVMRP